MRQTLLIYSVAFILLLYYGAALVCNSSTLIFHLFHPRWMDSFLYGVFWTEPIMIFLCVLVRSFKTYAETAVSISYIAAVIVSSLFLLKRKSWARKVILIQQILRAVSLTLFFILWLFIFVPSAVNQKTLWHGLGLTIALYLGFLLPSLILWRILTMQSVKQEFS